MVFSEAGAAKLVHSMRMMMEENPTFVFVKCDIKNAFNSISRARILEVLEGEDSLRHLSWQAALSLAPEGALENKGKVWGQAKDGVIQGLLPQEDTLLLVGILSSDSLTELCQLLGEHPRLAVMTWVYVAHLMWCSLPWRTSGGIYRRHVAFI